MSNELDDVDLDLERQLREAHSFAPRAELRDEVRSQLRPPARSWSVPWAGLSAAAAVLVAVVGVGLLLHSLPRGAGGGGAGSFGAAGAPQAAAADFGKLPRPDLAQTATRLSADGAAAPAAKSALPVSALVYRYAGAAGAACTPPANPTLNGYPVIGGAGCELGRGMTAASYRLGPAPSGAQLVYLAVPDGQFGYYEPVYELPDGTLQEALTPDELQN